MGFSGDQEVSAIVSKVSKSKTRGAPPEEVSKAGGTITITLVEVMTREPLATVHCRSSDTVGSLDPAVELQTGLQGPWDIIFEREVLTASQMLADAGVDDGATLLL